LLCSAKFWAEYLSFEKSFGDTKHLRKLFPRALGKCADYPSAIAEMWTQFEREEGSLEQLEAAERKIQLRLEAFAAEEAAAAAAAEEKQEKRKERDKEKRRERRQEERKRRRSGEASSTTTKKPRTETMATEEMKEDTEKEDSFKIPASLPPPAKKTSKPSSMKPPPGYKEEEEAVSTPAAVKGNSEERTIFLSNLEYSVEDSTIQEFCANITSGVGDIVEVRLIKTPAGKSKGFAYVEFSNKAAVEKALSYDRKPLGGRPVFISAVDKDKKGHQFR